MDEKKATATQLRIQIENVEKHLKAKRIKFFLGIWIGYSVLIFWVINHFDKFTNLIDFIYLAADSALLGSFFFWLNAFIWSFVCTSISDTDRYLKKLEKDYYEIL